MLDAFLLKHKSSNLAAAAFILSAKSIKKINAWNNEMEKVTGIKEKDLKEAIEDLKQFALEVNPKFLSTLKYKFQKNEYLNVAQIPFAFWVDHHVNVMCINNNDVDYSICRQSFW